jgi:hypothetical protein
MVPIKLGCELLLCVLPASIAMECVLDTCDFDIRFQSAHGPLNLRTRIIGRLGVMPKPTDRKAEYMCYSPSRRKTRELEGEEEYASRLVPGNYVIGNKIKSASPNSCRAQNS